MNADLLAQINRVNCGAAGVLGTGTANCPINRKRVIAAIFTKSGFEFEEELSLEYLQELQQRGIAIIVGKMVNFASQTAEDSINTYDSSRIKSKNGTSPYEYLATFDNGIYFYKALASIESFGSYDVTYVDEDLNIFFTATDDYAKGFTCGQIAVMPYEGANGNSPATNRLWWQELYRSEFDKDAAWITSDNHNIRAVNLDGVNDAVIAFEVVPSDGDLNIQFSLKTKADKKDVDLGGLVTADLIFKVNGSAVTLGTPTQNATTGVYTATFTPALETAEVVTLGLAATGFTTGIIKKGNRLYKANVAESVVLGN